MNGQLLLPKPSDPAGTGVEDLSPGRDSVYTRLFAGIGRLGPVALLSIGALGCVVLLGGYAYYRQLTHGLGVTGLSTIGRGGAAWGLYIVFDVYFVGVSFAGITIAALVRLFDIRPMKPLARMAELLTIVSLCMGGIVVICDLGRPLEGFIYLFKYARTQSPFFGTFSLVIGGYLFASLVYFFLAGRADAAYCAKRYPRFAWFYRLWAMGYKGTPAERERHHRTSFWLSLVILPLLITAHTTLGFIFGLQGGRPGWFSSIQGPAFVVLAGVSGIGLLIVAAAIVRKAFHLEDVIHLTSFRWLGNFLLVLTLAYLYLMVAEAMTSNYAAGEVETHLAHELMAGTYAPLYWTVFGSLAACALILFTQFLRGGPSVGWAVAAGLLANVAAVLKRFLIVVSSQIEGMLAPFPHGSYAPNWVELSIIAALISLGTLLFLGFAKVFPIVPLGSGGEPGGGEPTGTGPWRQGVIRPVLFGATLGGGLEMAIIGFLGASRFGTEPFLDPIIPFAPGLFVLGIMVALLSAVVYETLPELPDERERAPVGELVGAQQATAASGGGGG